MILLVQFSGGLLGLLAVSLGAFGAHALRNTLSEARMRSFETGIKYQFYHAILLLILGFNLGFTSRLESIMAYCLLLGILLFSFSIYALCLLPERKGQLRYLGLLTPLGGCLLLLGWGLLSYSFVREFI